MELNISVNIIGVLRQMKETGIKPNFFGIRSFI